MKKHVIVAVGCLTLALSACAVDPTERDPAFALDTAEQAFTESTCSGGSADSTTSGWPNLTDASCQNPLPPFIGDAATIGSVDGSYGHPLCSNAFIADFTAVTTSPAMQSDNMLSARDQGSTLSSSSCSRLQVALRAYVVTVRPTEA